MSSECVIAIYDDLNSAMHGAASLYNSKFPDEQVSLVTKNSKDEVENEAALRFGDNAEGDAAVGAGVGSILGLLAAAPVLAIPGIGPLLIAGPLAGAFTGGIVGGLVGAMAGWGVHSDHVAEYEEMVRDGKHLVIASGAPDEVVFAKNVLDKTANTTVSIHAQQSADSAEVDDRASKLKS